MFRSKQQGMGLIEIVIGSAIIVTGILGLSEAYATFVKYAFSNESNVQAAYLEEEGLEVLTFFRDTSWNGMIKTLSTTTTYSLQWRNNSWVATTTPQYVDGIFLRQFVVSDVYRDGSDRISASGTYDAGTKKVTITVAYPQGHATTTRSMSTYITDLYGN